MLFIIDLNMYYKISFKLGPGTKIYLLIYTYFENFLQIIFKLILNKLRA